MLKHLRFTALLALGACTLGGSGLNDVAQTKEPVRPTLNDPSRLAAMKQLGTKLDKQTASLTKRKSTPTNNSIEVASLRPKVTKSVSSLITKSTVGTPTTLKASRKTNTEVAVIPRLQEIPNQVGPLGRFHKKLSDLRSGKRTKAVTILHIGDSHIASDSFSRGIRKALQARYGNAGRGMVIPARAFKYGVADQLKFSTSGNWRGSTALKTKRGRFGISGVSVSSRSSRASMKMTSKSGAFDWARITVATGPSQGSFTMKVGNNSKRFDAYSKRKGSKQFTLSARGRSLVIIPGGGAQTTVLNWSTGKNTPGVRYVNFGLIGATLNITKRFNKNLVANDVRRLDPDLIIYGYGTNEGFNDKLHLASYRKKMARYMASLSRSAPNADVVYLGASSGLRRRGNKACGGWSIPPKLGPLRKTMRNFATDQGAAYWDWSASMGGVCSVNAWAGQGLAAKDRVHLTSKGYRRSAAAFAKWLTAPVINKTNIALNN